jgi:hypothetical protein
VIAASLLPSKCACKKRQHKSIPLQSKARHDCNSTVLNYLVSPRARLKTAGKNLPSGAWETADKL